MNKMKFILSDFLPRQQLEKAKSGFDVLCLMAVRGELLSPKDYSFLEEVLKEVGKEEFIKSCSTSLPSMPSFNVDTSNSISQYLRPKLLQVKKFLGELADNLSSENVHDLCLFFAGICGSINYQNVNDIKSAEELFSRLLESHLIGTGNLQPLQRVFELIGRLDLASSIETFNTGVWQSVNDNPSLPMPVEDEECSIRGIYTHTYLSVTFLSCCFSDIDSLPEKDSASSTQQLLLNIDIQEETVERQQDEIIRLHHQLTRNSEFQDRDNTELQLLRKELKRKTDEVLTLNNSIGKLQELLWAKPDVPIYEMKQDPHGLAIVIVNGFDPGSGTSLKPRRGAVKDGECFIQAFGFLNYTVNVYSDMTAEEMKSLMTKVGSCDHSEYDSFVCCVSSHGNEVGIYGNDSALLQRNSFIDPIKSCASLRSKPKLFFFQACRVPEVSADSPEQSWSEPLSTLHRDSDILIANASTAGNPAYTSPETGSWFAKAIELKFTNTQLVHERTVQQLLEEVTDLVSGAEGQLCSGERVNQCVEVTTRMRKGVKFF